MLESIWNRGGGTIGKTSHSGFLRTVLVFIFVSILSALTFPERAEVNLLLFSLSLLDFAFRLLISYVIYSYRHVPMKMGISLITFSGLLNFLNSHLIVPHFDLISTLSNLSGCAIMALSLLWFFRDFIAEELHRLIYTDYLTGALNRQAFVRLANKKLRSLKVGKTACLIYLDLDNFKRVNDLYGHPFGDKLLQAAVRRIKTSIRSEDLLGRIGGDEFVVLLPHADAETAKEVLMRIHEKFCQPFSIDGIRIELSLSAGTAVYPTDGQNLQDLIEVSDRAMYRTKMAKRGETRVRRSEEAAG
ncbi:GGDEF domain-containing protein [Thermotoga caldifontis]|uniref:GGDEF domain-containing protein n=1 Tax=Thermotoga caldifontis TaxID=1508419 RepID=UPI000B161BA3|nr:GGDEF domain-containing protein [Thermotoga caldifontis]